jgi:FAD/FMN-containing dehydrogenase
MSTMDAPDGVVTFGQEEVGALRIDLAGAAILPGDQAYDLERVGYNLLDNSRPAVIVVARTPGDVAAAVSFAVTHGLPVAVRATGHGSVSCTGAVLIKTHQMTAVSVDESRAIASVEPGVRWGDVIEQAAKVGLAPLNGSSPTVGVVGYSLGGGHSLMARLYGMAADHVIGFRLVDAHGYLQHVTPESDPDLFWAVLGSRGNFGVVTNLEFKLFPVTRLYGGGLYFPGERTPEVLEAWRTWVDEMPDAMGSSVALLRLPDIPELPDTLRGRFVTHVRIAYVGDAADGEELVAPLRAVGERLVDTVTDMPYSAVASIHSDPPDPMPYYDTSALLSGLDSVTIEKIMELAGPAAAMPPALLEIRHLGGKLDDRPDGHVIDLSGAKFTLFATIMAVAADRAAEAVLARGALATMIAELAPWIDGRRYANFLSPDDPHEVVTATYRPEALNRLRTLKARYDADNIFRYNHNIAPA